MPTTTTGLATSFINFTRTSNATVTDSDGKIKWAGHNLLLNSESFDTGSYGSVGLLAFGSGSSANSTAAPNGTTTADYIRETNANSRHFIFANPTTIAGANYTARVFVKAAERTFIALGIRTTDGVTGYAAAFNLSTGAMTATSSTGTPTNTSAPPPLDVGSGWYLLSVSMDATTNSAYVEIGLSDSATPTFAAGMPTYTGTGTSGLYLWGAHFYRSDLGGMVLNPAQPAGFGSYYPTTPPNLLGYTESFDNVYWGKQNTTITANVIIAPNGLQTADKLVENTANNQHYVALGVQGGDTNTFSVFAKAGERNWMTLYLGTSNSSAYFNLASGVVGTVQSSVTASITPVGNGWHRCSITGTQIGAGAVTRGIYIATGDGTNSYAGDGTSGIYIWGVQLSNSASLDAYSPVYGAAVTSAAYYAPRLDYDANGSALGLLVEEQRTNLITYSADFTQWNAQSGVSVTANQAIAPDGTLSADLIVGNGTTGVTSSPVTVSGASNNTKSVWLRSVTGTATVLLKDPQVTVGTVTCNLTTTWQRFTLTETQSGGSAGIWIDDVPAAGIYAWGAQLEQGSFATSYIPNGAATAGATRTADAASVSTQAFPYSSTASSIVISLRHPTATSPLGSNQGHWRLDLAGSPVVRQDRFDNSANIAFRGLSLNVDTGKSLGASVGKVATAFTTGDVALVVNGGSAYTNSSATGSQVADNFLIGRTGVTSEYLNGWIRQITYIPRRLSNSELQARTV